MLEPRWRERLRSGGAIALVAESSAGEVIGFATGGPKVGARFPEYDAELYTIYLLQGHQRSGVGWRIFAAVADRLRREGKGSMLLWVLEDNPARGFYEKLGGNLLGGREIEVCGARLTELAYGWRNMEGAVELTRRAEC